MEFDKTLRFWYPHVAHDAWIDFSSQTIGTQGKSPFFFPPLFFISLTIFLSLMFVFLLSSTFFLYPSNSFLFCSHPHLLIFSFLFFLLFLSFSLSFHFLLSLFLIVIDLIGQVGKLPPHFPSLPHVLFPHFSLFS